MDNGEKEYKHRAGQEARASRQGLLFLQTPAGQEDLKSSEGRDWAVYHVLPQSKEPARFHVASVKSLVLPLGCLE